MRLHLTSCRVADSRARRRPFRFAALTVVVLLAACGRGDGPTAPTERPPVLGKVSVAKSSSTYLRATLTANASDPDGNLSRVVIDWGDKTTYEVTSGFDAIATTHDYATHDKYVVTVTAFDVAGNLARTTSTVTLDAVPGGCLDVYVLAFCAQVQPSYRGIDFVTRLGNIDVTKTTLSTTNNYSEVFVPVGGLLGQVKVVTIANFSKTKGKSSLDIKVYGCTLVLICTGQLADKSFDW